MKNSSNGSSSSSGRNRFSGYYAEAGDFESCGLDEALKQNCSQLVKDFCFVRDVTNLIESENLTNLLLRSRLVKILVMPEWNKDN